MGRVDARDSRRGVEAARRVMLELWSIVAEYRDTPVGGSRVGCGLRIKNSISILTWEPVSAKLLAIPPAAPSVGPRGHRHGGLVFISGGI